MNPDLAFIFNRRSVRQYTDRDVSPAMVRDLLEAAMAAPSAVARDPWEFIVIRKRDMLAKVAQALPNGKMLGDAAVGIIVCGDMECAHGGELSFMLQDCSAAIENLLLAAQALGLGACWLGVHPRQDRIDHIRSVFQLPEAIVPVSAIAIGWPAQKPEPRTRYDEASVHCDAW